MPAVSGEPLRGVAVSRLTDGLTVRGFAVSIDDVAPTTVTADQSTWNGASGSSATLRMEWETTGLPLFQQATIARVRVRLPGDASNIGASWDVTITGDNGSSALTFHYDDSPLSGSLGTARCGMLEIFLEVQSVGGIAPWGPIDSRGNGTPPAGTTHDWARGYLRSNVVLSSYSISNVSLGGAEPASFAFSDMTFNRVTLDATCFRNSIVELKHRQSAADVRTQSSSSSTSTQRDYTWNAVANGATSNGRINKDYANGNVDVWVVLPGTAFGGDAEYAWASSGHAAGFSVSNDAIIEDVARFTANPTITMTNLTFTDQIYNPYELANYKFKIQNARGEINTTSTISIQVRSQDDELVEDRTLGIVSSFYDAAPYYVHPEGHAPWDLVGERWNIRTNYTDMDSLNIVNDIFKVSRKMQVSTSDEEIDGAVFVGEAHSPTDNERNKITRCGTLFFSAYLYAARGTLWGVDNPIQHDGVYINARGTATETFFSPHDFARVVSGGVTGITADWKASSQESNGGKAIVLATYPAEGTNQPRTGIEGTGGFAETTLAVIEVVDSYTDDSGLRRMSSCAECCDCPCEEICSQCVTSHRVMPSMFDLIVSGVLLDLPGCREFNGKFLLKLFKYDGGLTPCVWGSLNKVLGWPHTIGGRTYCLWELARSPTWDWQLSAGVDNDHTNSPGRIYQASGKTARDFNGDCSDTVFDAWFDPDPLYGSPCDFSSAVAIVRPRYKCIRPAEGCFPNAPLPNHCDKRMARRLKFTWNGSAVVLTTAYEFVFPYLINYLEQKEPFFTTPQWWVSTSSTTPGTVFLRRDSPVIRYSRSLASYMCHGDNTFTNDNADGNPATVTVESLPC